MGEHGELEKVLEAVGRGVPLRALERRVRRRKPALYGQDYLGECMLRLIEAEGGALTPRPDPFLLLECLRIRNLWRYYGASAPSGREVEDWVFGLGEIKGFPQIPPGFARAKWLFGQAFPDWMLERGYFYTLAFRPEVPPQHQAVFLDASSGDMRAFRRSRARMRQDYLQGLRAVRPRR